MLQDTLCLAFPLFWQLPVYDYQGISGTQRTSTRSTSLSSQATNTDKSLCVGTDEICMHVRLDYTPRLWEPGPLGSWFPSISPRWWVQAGLERQLPSLQRRTSNEPQLNWPRKHIRYNIKFSEFGLFSYFELSLHFIESSIETCSKWSCYANPYRSILIPINSRFSGENDSVEGGNPWTDMYINYFNPWTEDTERVEIGRPTGARKAP